jgi:hypothetical protein
MYLVYLDMPWTYLFAGFGRSTDQLSDEGELVCLRKKARRSAPFNSDFRGACGAPVTHSAGCPTVFLPLSSEAVIDCRIGRTTNRAMATTMKFMIAATANTECQLPV